MNTKRLAALAAATAVTSLAAIGGPANHAAARITTTPPAPAAPVSVYTENFENNPGTAGTAIFLTDYTGTAPLNETYTADPSWINGPGCDGLIGASGTSVGTTGCSQSNWDTYIGPMATAIGNAFGGGTGNNVMSDVTANTGVTAKPNVATFQTVNPIPLPSANHFITFSADVAATRCAYSAPLLQFFLLNGTSSTSTNASLINPCTDPRGTSVAGGSGGIQVGRYPSDTAILFGGASVGVELTDAQTSSSGNDYVVDNVQVLDATPQLSKDFASPAVAGQPDVLTFTITNTTDLASKNGWSFTDALPAGMTVAATPNASTTCSNTPAATAITAAAGGSTISVTGNLAAGASACTVSVAVNAPSGNYTNGSGNITSLTGLLAPPDTSITFNTAPTVLDDTTQVSPTAPTPLNPLGNDFAAPGATLVPSSVRLLDSGGNPQTTVTNSAGTYTANSDGTVTFTPATGFTGTAPPVPYQVTDSNGVTGTANLIVTTLAPPTVNNLSADTTPGTAVTVDPSTSDHGNGGATLVPGSVVLIDPSGAHVTTLSTPDGTYSVNTSTGVITFTPAAGFTGNTPPVPYEITDSNGTTGAATVAFTVAPTAGTPLANPTAAAVAATVLCLIGLGAHRLRRRRTN